MKIAKIFKNGRSQAVRLPKEFRFTENEVFIKKIGDTIILLPKNSSWKSMIDSLDLFSPDFLNKRNQLELENREDIFS